MTPLFVYGTLRRGERNHHLLGNAQFAGATTVHGYRRFRGPLGPAVVTAPGQSVDGEIFIVDAPTLARIDAHEHADRPDGKYRRVELPDNHGFNPHMYLYIGEVVEGLMERIRAVPPLRPVEMPQMPCLALTGQLAVVGEPSGERVERGDPARLAPAPNTPAWTAHEDVAKHALNQRGVVVADLIACGGLGCAYAAQGQPNLVVKITGDPSEAAAAQTVVTAVGEGRADWDRDLPALVRFLCVYALEDVPLFVIMQERLAGHLPADANEFVWKHKIMQSHRFALVAGKADDYRMRARLRTEAQERGLLPEFDRLLRTLDTLHRLGIEWHDLHTGNIMQDAQGHWRVLDLGESYSGTVEIPSFAADAPGPENRSARVDQVEHLRTRRVSAKHSNETDPSRDTFYDKTWNADAEKAHKMLRSNGIYLDDYVGCGSYGCAFGQASMVVKLTQDVNEVANAKIVQQNGGCPGVAEIRAVFAFDGLDNMYAVFLEPLQPLTDAEQEFIWDPLEEGGEAPQRIDSARWEYHYGTITGRQYDAFLRKVRAAARERLGKEGAKAVGSLIKGVECLYALGIEYSDGHHENVLARWTSKGKREFVYLDLGHSVGPNTRVTVMERSS